MANKPLPNHAENLRKQIKSLIPEVRGIDDSRCDTATVLNEDSEGNKEYVGDILGQKISALVQHLPIGDVSKTLEAVLHVLTVLGLGMDSVLFPKVQRNQERTQTNVPDTTI